jgi:hypothetical protein
MMIEKLLPFNTYIYIHTYIPYLHKVCHKGIRMQSKS